MPEMKKTPLYDQHLALKGKLIDFGGWFLPVSYRGIIEEVLQTRNKASVFDASHMGEFFVEGRQAEDFLQHVLTNDLSRLKDNGIIYSPLCYPHGGTVDDILVYRYTREKFLLVVNASNTPKDYNWLQERLPAAVTLRDCSDEFALLAVQGPSSLEILHRVTKDVPLSGLKYYTFLPRVKIAGIDCLLSRTGYTGEDGFEILCPAHKAAALWEALLTVGQSESLSLLPAGLGARDVLRLEAALPLYGHELTREITPLEAGLGKFVALKKKTAFIGQEALLKQKEEGLKRCLAGLIMLDRGIPREGYTVKMGQAEIGWISSGTFSPTLQSSLGLAFLDMAKAVRGAEVKVLIRHKECRAQVVQIPFYKRGEALTKKV